MDSSSCVWYEISSLVAGPDVYEIGVRIPADSPWFDGHFPGRPVLPGIAQLAMVQDLLSRVLGDGGRISALRRVRFRQAVGPGARLKVTARRAGGDTGDVNFRILEGEALVCGGTAVPQKAGQQEAVEGETSDGHGIGAPHEAHRRHHDR